MSYVQAIEDFPRSKISYQMNSQFFSIDQTTGKVFLVSKLRLPDPSLPLSLLQVNLTATNGVFSESITNTIGILNANNKPPVFHSKQRVFEIEEVHIS